MTDIASGGTPGDVVIVSAFGRGELLAVELKTRGMNVTVVDVSAGLGERPVAELEGPFPIVRPNPLLPGHLEWLMNHSFEEIKNGFSIWLKSGPVDFRGPLASFYQTENAAIGRFREHYESWREGGAKQVEALRQPGDMSFEENWLIQLAHGFAANEFRRSTECYQLGEPFPLHSVIQSPVFSEQTLERIQTDVKNSGVRWISAEGVSDVLVEKGRLIDMELAMGRKEVLSGQYFVWCLSSEETESISRKVARSLFPQGVVTGEWAWRRFQVHSGKNPLENVVPPYLVMIEDVHFPWAYDNFIVLKRRRSELIDLWVRLPAENSKRPDQLKKFIGKLAARLDQRFPHWQHEIEASWNEGPSLYPVFENKTLQRFLRSGSDLSNVVFEGIEHLPRQDWAGRFQVQTSSMLKIQSLHAQELAKVKRRDPPNDRALHAP